MKELAFIGLAIGLILLLMIYRHEKAAWRDAARHQSASSRRRPAMNHADLLRALDDAEARADEILRRRKEFVLEPRVIPPWDEREE